jgi:hypothetical protein
MTFWYNPSSQGGFASASCTKWNEVNSKIVFEEFGIKEDDSFFYIYGYAKSFTNCKSFKDNNWVFEPQNISIRLAKKDYTKSYQDKITEVKQSSIEKFAVDALASWDKSRLYTGNVYFQSLQQYDWYVEGTLEPAMKSAFIAGMFHTSPLDKEPQHIKLDDFVPVASGVSSIFNKGSGGRGQTEYEKLKDRQQFFLDFFKSAFPDEKVETIADLIRLEEKPNYWSVVNLFNELFSTSIVKK